eukprot:1770319-Rhodomonas_salina.1
MDDQGHQVSLMMSAESRKLAEETDDPMWAELQRDAFLHSFNSFKSVSLPSQQRERHCHHWQPSRPLLFSLYPDRNNPSILRLHLRVDSRPHVKSGCTGFPSSSQNLASQSPLPANGVWDDSGEELDLDPPGEPPAIPEYAEADLEE